MAIDEDDDAPVAEELDDEELDAPGEPDDEVEVEDEGTDADAEGEDDDDEGEFVGAVKTRSARSRVKKIPDEDEESIVEEPDRDADSDDSSQPDEEDWEAADDLEEDQKIASAEANRCVYVKCGRDGCIKANSHCSFCQQTEENDPSEDYEEYLACSVCGDNGKWIEARACNCTFSVEGRKKCGKETNEIDLRGPSADFCSCSPSAMCQRCRLASF
jgi:histone acetyltransferase SAS3